MALTPAERQRRSRRHRAGDHSLCDPDRCRVLAGPPAVTCDVTLPGLGKRGADLWQAVHAEGPVPAGAGAALLEACRIADRLDTLHAILRGADQGWMRVQVGDGGEVTVSVDRVLAEARAQAVALKQLVAEVRQSRRGATDQPGREVSIFDELRARREARRAASGA